MNLKHQKLRFQQELASLPEVDSGNQFERKRHSNVTRSLNQIKGQNSL